jgi:hypothetical protein
VELYKKDIKNCQITNWNDKSKNTADWVKSINPLNAELNPIYPLPALFGAHHILHVSRIRVKEAKVCTGL